MRCKNEKIIDYYIDLLPIFDTRIAMLNEINERDIEGSTAELGIYRGDFSKYINQVFTNRKLYLFDTFSGFDKQDGSMKGKRIYQSLSKVIFVMKI